MNEENKNKQLGYLIALFMFAMFTSVIFAIYKKEKFFDLNNAALSRACYYQQDQAYSINLLPRAEYNFLKIQHPTLFDRLVYAEFLNSAQQYSGCVAQLKICLEYKLTNDLRETILFKLACAINNLFYLSDSERFEEVNKVIDNLMSIGTRSSKELAAEILMSIQQNKKAIQIIKNLIEDEKYPSKEFKLLYTLKKLEKEDND